MKKAQITIFITLAVIIMLLGFTILFLYQFPKIQSEKSSTDVQSFINQCVKDTTDDGIILLGLQGGHIYPTNFLETPYQKISYDLPTKVQMQKQLNSFVESALPRCINNTYFKDYGYDITYTNPTVNSEINDRVVIATIKFPIQIVKDKNIKNLENFVARSSIRFGYAYTIIKELRTQKEWLDLTKVSQYDIDITIIPYNNHTIIHVRDPKSFIDSDNFRFVTVI